MERARNVYWVIKVIKDKTLNVALLTYNRRHSDTYDFNNNPWIKYCKGAVIDLDTNKVICLPPIKSDESFDINKLVNEYNSEYIYQPLIDGTMINMFYKKNDWRLCTRSNIGANNSWDSKIKFKDLFIEINGQEWFNQLDKDKCYTFVFQHNKNRIVTPVINDQIFLISCYDITSDYPIKCDLPVIDGIINIFNINEGELKSYTYEGLYYSIKGLNINAGDQRIKWINPEFKKVFDIKPNSNNKLLNYIELYRNNRLKIYLNYFPEDTEGVSNFYNKYMTLKNTLFKTYTNTHISKTITIKEVHHILKPLIYEIHGLYLKKKEKITHDKIVNFIDSLPERRLLFILNRL